ncbi:ubiquitin thioesterase OTUB2 isoform X2 [Spea bombifrons]|uniref:ubiquitin thioesterase OTUB2 isoform X2 n=1 Tax=Spea bombifrons TaxID=233779 RepID=UPI0023491985|nr:ubiquitin thioesterase OTUB2 isoform X2 [Spea bombifrons]
MSENELISEKRDIGEFIEEHAKDPLYQRKLKELQKRYSAVRKTRADGSCFYRGLVFAYLEFLIGKQQELVRFKDVVVRSKQELLAAVFQEHVIKQHYETFLSIVDSVAAEGSVSNLTRVFNHQLSSDSAVQFLRLVTSAFVRNRAEFYLPFVDEETNIPDFCTQHVEPMTSECDHVQMTALSQALEISLQVECVDEMDTVINHHIFPEGASPSVFMLYKNNHYTILYRVQPQGVDDL